jgi:hypothetical protein
MTDKAREPAEVSRPLTGYLWGGIGGAELPIVLTGTGAGVFLGDYWVIVGIALTGYLDYVLLPALAIFIGLTVYALWRKRQYDACCDTPSEKESQP